MTEVTFEEFLSAIHLPGSQEVDAGDVYADPRIAAARAIHEARLGKGRGVVLVQADNEGQARACARYVSAMFMDEPLLTKDLKSQRSDEFMLRNGRLIVVTSMPRSPAHLIVTLRLTGGAAEPVEPALDTSTMSDGEKLNYVAHVLATALIHGRAAGEVLDAKAIELMRLMGDPDVPEDPKLAYQHLDGVFQRMSEAHAAERAEQWEFRHGSSSASGSITPSGSLDYARAVMQGTSVPCVPRGETEEEALAKQMLKITQTKAANQGLTPRVSGQQQALMGKRPRH